MAYFANSSEGSVFDLQCSMCKYTEEPCPIAAVQSFYNYTAANNKTARAILDDLVADDGTCAMYVMMGQADPKDGDIPLNRRNVGPAYGK